MTVYSPTIEELDAQIELLSEEEKLALLRLAHLSLAKTDNAEGFFSFYYLVFGKDIPPHAKEWVTAIYDARATKKRGVVIEAFRGSTKTTTLTVGFTAWRIGWNPERSNLLIQVGDDIANDNTKLVADIIANNPGFRDVFPTVVPDRESSWGAGGYEVKRNDMDYGEWRSLCASRHEPTLVGVGYKSREIIGKHPNGMLIIDDIHDENNTSSGRELDTVKKILTGTIFPTMTPETWCVFVGTPWVDADVLHYVAANEEFVHLKTPAFVYDPDGPGEFEGQKVRYAWPGRYAKRQLTTAKNLSGTIQFARMYQLDLTAAGNQVFKYMTFPNDSIRFNWPMVGGVDYAGTMNWSRNAEGKNDLFALAYVCKLPGGGAVVVDGVIARCTQAEAEAYIIRAQGIFPMWLSCVVEADTRGEDFIQVVRRNPGIKLIPLKTGGRSKRNRLEVELSPWMENGTVRVSDAETPFLIELRKELDSYPLNERDDALDAVYWALHGMPDVLVMPHSNSELPQAVLEKKKVNPFLAFGSLR